MIKDKCLSSLFFISNHVKKKYDSTLYGVCFYLHKTQLVVNKYRDADKSLARPTSRCILFDGENTSFDASLVTYIKSTNIPPIMIINRIYEHQNLLSL